MSRKAQIEALLQEDENDVFLRYSLAMELQKEGDYEQCLEIFQSLMDDQPPYVPAFFMAAQQRAKLGDIDLAKDFLRKGSEEARNQGNAHAAAEMSEMLQNL